MEWGTGSIMILLGYDESASLVEGGCSQHRPCRCVRCTGLHGGDVRPIFSERNVRGVKFNEWVAYIARIFQ